MSVWLAGADFRTGITYSPGRHISVLRIQFHMLDEYTTMFACMCFVGSSFAVACNTDHRERLEFYGIYWISIYRIDSSRFFLT